MYKYVIVSSLRFWRHPLVNLVDPFGFVIKQDILAPVAPGEDFCLNRPNRRGARALNSVGWMSGPVALALGLCSKPLRNTGSRILFWTCRFARKSRCYFIFQGTKSHQTF